jgi:hypothetical protein
MIGKWLLACQEPALTFSGEAKISYDPSTDTIQAWLAAD